MLALPLHAFHESHRALFITLNDAEAVDHYGDPLAEHSALTQSVGVLDLSFRGRLCLTGADRVRFLNGQVTNNVKDLPAGRGCYATVISAKGKLQSDLNLYRLPDELLLDFEPGLTAFLTQRFEHYLIADDVQVVDVAPHYGLLSVQGPQAEHLIRQTDLAPDIPALPFQVSVLKEAARGDLYLMNQSRAGATGFDWFVPTGALPSLVDRLVTAATSVGGRLCGWRALDMARIEAGIPRYGVDMDETNLPPEAGLTERAISYTKGCYIGQEVIARLRAHGQVTKTLCGLRLDDPLPQLPVKGDKLFHGGKEVGYITSAVASPALQANLALGYVRREANRGGTELQLKSATSESSARIVELPFVKKSPGHV